MICPGPYALPYQLSKLSKAMEQVYKDDDLQCHQPISPCDPGKQPPEICRGANLQILNQPVYEHDCHTYDAEEGTGPEAQIQWYGNQIADQHAGASGTDRKLVSFVAKTPIRPLMTATGGTKHHHPEIDPVLPGQLAREPVFHWGVFSHTAQPA